MAGTEISAMQRLNWYAYDRNDDKEKDRGDGFEKENKGPFGFL